MSDNKRAELVQAIRSGWPAHGSTNYQNRGYAEVPPVRDGGMTARVIDYAVDTALAKMTPRTVTTEDELEGLADYAVVLDNYSDVAQKRGGKWCGYEVASISSHAMRKYLPVTVLHEPTP